MARMFMMISLLLASSGLSGIIGPSAPTEFISVCTATRMVYCKPKSDNSGFDVKSLLSTIQLPTLPLLSFSVKAK